MRKSWGYLNSAEKRLFRYRQGAAYKDAPDDVLSWLYEREDYTSQDHVLQSLKELSETDFNLPDGCALYDALFAAENRLADFTPESIGAELELYQHIFQGLEFTVLWANTVNGRSTKEIAQTLTNTVHFDGNVVSVEAKGKKSIENILYRARKKLRKTLAHSNECDSL